MGKFAEKVAAAVYSRGSEQVDTLVWRMAKHASSAFTGATSNQHGDKDGTNNPYTLFTVTGDIVIAAIWGIVNTDLTGASGTVSVGVTGNTAALIALETATELDDGGVFVSATQVVGAGVIPGSGALTAINDGLDIIETVATTDIASGQIDYYVVWAPAEVGATLVSAAAVA